MEKRKFRMRKPKAHRCHKNSQSRFSFKKAGWEEKSPETKRLYSSKKWQELRKYILSRHPLCFFDNHPATELHHIEPVKEHPEKFFEVNNLMPLCDECHEKVNQAYRRGIEPEVIFPKNMRLKYDVS